MQDYSTTLKNTCLRKLRRLYPTGLIIPAAYLRSLVQGVPSWGITVPHSKEPTRISVNHDLNSYSFLITTIHEFAHLQTWNKHQHRVKPHGTEWKNNFKELMEPFLKLNIFPIDISSAIHRYMENPAASSCTDLHLFRTLKSYDTVKTSALTVESLEDGHFFKLKMVVHFNALKR
jgi:hypothetical protein